MTAQDSPAPVREVARLLTRQTQRELHVMDNGGHMMPITNPAAVIDVVQAFLGRAEDARPTCLLSAGVGGSSGETRYECRRRDGCAARRLALSDATARVTTSLT
jgi:hypothetical protein